MNSGGRNLRGSLAATTEEESGLWHLPWDRLLSSYPSLSFLLTRQGQLWHFPGSWNARADISSTLGLHCTYWVLPCSNNTAAAGGAEAGISAMTGDSWERKLQQPPPRMAPQSKPWSCEEQHSQKGLQLHRGEFQLNLLEKWMTSQLNTAEAEGMQQNHRSQRRACTCTAPLLFPSWSHQDIWRRVKHSSFSWGVCSPIQGVSAPALSIPRTVPKLSGNIKQQEKETRKKAREKRKKESRKYQDYIETLKRNFENSSWLLTEVASWDDADISDVPRS